MMLQRFWQKDARPRRAKQARRSLEMLESRSLMTVVPAAHAVVDLDPSARGSVIYRKPVADAALKDELETLADTHGWTIRVTGVQRAKDAVDIRVDGLSTSQVFQALRSDSSLAEDYRVILGGKGAKSINIGKLDDGQSSEFLTQGASKKKLVNVGSAVPASLASSATAPEGLATQPSASTPEDTTSPTSAPKASASVTSLSFSVANPGDTVATQTFKVTNTGGGTLVFSVCGFPASGIGPNRITITDAAGDTNLGFNDLTLAAGESAEFTVSVDTAGLPAGQTYSTGIAVGVPQSGGWATAVWVPLTVAVGGDGSSSEQTDPVVALPLPDDAFFHLNDGIVGGPAICVIAPEFANNPVR